MMPVEKRLVSGKIGEGWCVLRHEALLALLSLFAIGAAVRDDPAATRGASPPR
jgi:hypothetical protein